MPFWLLGTLLATYRPLSYSTFSWPLSIFPAAQSLPAGDAELEPCWNRTSRNSRARNRRDILIGAEVASVGDRCRSRAEVPRAQVFGTETRAAENGPFSRIRAWGRSRQGIKLGARAGMLPWSRSRIRSTISRLNIPDFGHVVRPPPLRLIVLLTTLLPLGCPTTSWPNGALWGCSHSPSGTGNKQGRSGDGSMETKRWCTDHTNIQSMPGPLDLRLSCNYLKKTAII